MLTSLSTLSVRSIGPLQSRCLVGLSFPWDKHNLFKASGMTTSCTCIQDYRLPSAGCSGVPLC